MIPRVPALLSVFLAACVQRQGPAALVAAGQYSCGQIDQCFAQCPPGDRRCVEWCRAQGTPEAQRLSSAMWGCAQRNECMNPDCVETMCAAEVQACRANVAVTAGAAPARPAGANARPVGSWTYGSVTGPFFDPQANTWGVKPVGNAGRLVLREDGTFEHGTLLALSVAGCRSAVYGWKQGTWSVVGDELILAATRAWAKVEDSCNQANNVDQADPPGVKTYRFRLGGDANAGDETLTLQTQDGQFYGGPYYRDR